MKIIFIVVLVIVGLVVLYLLSGGALVLLTPSSGARVTAAVAQVVSGKEIVIEISNNSKKNTITEIAVSRDTAAALGLSVPPGFAEEPLPLDKGSEKDKEMVQFVSEYNKENLRWVGQFTLAPDANSRLAIPARNTAKLAGRINFKYEAKVGFGGSISSLSVNLEQQK